jgi:hypothetical protein
MAGQAAKKMAERNANIIASHTIAYLLTLGIYILFKLIYGWSSYTTWDGIWFVTINSATIILYKQMIGSGMDLSKEGGLLSFYYDVLYISWFTLASVTISSKFYWTLIFVPIFGLIKLKSLLSSLYGMVTGARPDSSKKRR